MHTSPLTLESLLILFSFCGILWAIFKVHSDLKQGQRDNRVILNVVCDRLGIDPKKIIHDDGGK